jgi:hypothetical protein
MPEQITVSVSDDAIGRIDEVVTALENGGMHIDQVLRPIGVITGSADTQRVRALGSVAGVAAVEPQRTVRLPPPGSDVQ